MSNDWGTIAASCRLNRTEPAFVVCWTALVGGGLRQGDNVIPPAYDLPAHKAASHLARRFLMSGNDTLLMIDDDMAFAQDAVERLRANEANWEYDIVMAFCTTRGIPPQPVILQEMAEQPGPPLSLKGERFRRVYDFEDGEVIPVGTTGLAFTLIRRRVFEAMLNEYDLEYNYFFEYGLGEETEDIPFCRRARGLGFKLAVDTSVHIEHITSMRLGPAQFRAWYEEHKNGDKAETEVPA
jgi:GT2 family glycosyltransferase